MVLFVSGLKAVPQPLYDAAAVDGADGVLDRLRIVTLPMLGPVTMFRRHPDGETVLRGLRQRSRPDPGRAELCVRSAAISALHRELRFPAHGIWRSAHRGLSRNHCAAYAYTGAASRTAGALLVIARFPDRRFAGRVARHAIVDSHRGFRAAAVLLDGEPVAQTAGRDLPGRFPLLADGLSWGRELPHRANCGADVPLPVKRVAGVRSDLRAAAPCLHSLCLCTCEATFSRQGHLVLRGVGRPAAAASSARHSAFRPVERVWASGHLCPGSILPWAISTFGIFLLRQFFRSIPDEMIHAARLDGLGEFEIIWRIMIPMTAPGAGCLWHLLGRGRLERLVLAAHRGAPRGNFHAERSAFCSSVTMKPRNASAR